MGKSDLAQKAIEVAGRGVAISLLHVCSELGVTVEEIKAIDARDLELVYTKIGVNMLDNACVKGVPANLAIWLFENRFGEKYVTPENAIKDNAAEWAIDFMNLGKDASESE